MQPTTVIGRMGPTFPFFSGLQLVWFRSFLDTVCLTVFSIIYLYAFISVCSYLFPYLSIYLSISVCSYLSICIHHSLFISIYLSMFIFNYFSLSVSGFSYAYIYIYIYSLEDLSEPLDDGDEWRERLKEIYDCSRTWLYIYIYIYIYHPQTVFRSITTHQCGYTRKMLQTGSKPFSLLMSIYFSTFVCMNVSIYFSVLMSIYVSMYICIYLSIYFGLFISISVCMYKCIYLSIYLSLSVFVCVCVRKCGDYNMSPVMEGVKMGGKKTESQVVTTRVYPCDHCY